MIPRDRLAAIAALPEGTLREVPFAVLLHALAVTGRSGLLSIERPPLHKEIVLEAGVPVDCRSNLAHETLGRFMVAVGKLDDLGLNRALADSLQKDLPLGQVLLDQRLVTPEELERILQQNLAKKLLDGFSWREGSFRLVDESPAVVSPLKVNVPQLIVLGVTRFADQGQVDAAVGPLVGKRLQLNPDVFYALDDVRFTPRQRAVLDAFAEPRRMDEVAAATGIPAGELSRLLFALATIGAVAASRPAAPATAGKVPTPPAPASSSTPPTHPAVAPEDLTRVFLEHRRRDAFELLDVNEEVGPAELAARYLELARRFAPWAQDPALADKAEAVFLALARAYAGLVHPDSRKRLIEDRRARAQEKASFKDESQREFDRDRFRIKTDLLDPAVQFADGRLLMTAGEFQRALAQLAYAANLDPQNGEYRAELAWCRLRTEPVTGARRAAEELTDAIRIDPRCGLASYYLGQVLRQLGRTADAEVQLRRAIKLMAPDRRPIEALKAMANDPRR